MNLSKEEKQMALGYMEMAELNLKIANNECEEINNASITNEESSTSPWNG